MKAKIKGAFEIPQDSLDCYNMRVHWIMHELTSLIHEEGNSRPCECEILQGSHNAPVLLQMRIRLASILEHVMIRKTRSSIWF